MKSEGEFPVREVTSTRKFRNRNLGTRIFLLNPVYGNFSVYGFDPPARNGINGNCDSEIGYGHPVTKRKKRGLPNFPAFFRNVNVTGLNRKTVTE